MTWTEERRKQQAERARQTRPWEKSTGPRTRAGKAQSRMNARKHGGRRTELQLARSLIKTHREFMLFWIKLMIAQNAGLCDTNELNKKTLTIKDMSPSKKISRNELKEQ